jgi:hypothetical protein
MGAGIGADLRKSFAMASKGPTSMLGKTVKRGTVVTDAFHDAEVERVESRKAAAKRGLKPKVDKEKRKKKNPAAANRGGKRPDKRKRNQYKNWDYEVFSQPIPRIL